jgi:hypothetical protein
MVPGAEVLNRRWYAIRVASNWEKPTAKALRGRGIEELLPLFNQRRSWSKHFRIVERPLFSDTGRGPHRGRRQDTGACAGQRNRRRETDPRIASAARTM